jgi:SAM-dependent methyltransferase
MTTMRSLLAAAALLDRAHRRVRGALDFSARPVWLREFANLTGDARLTREEFWVHYALARKEAQAAMLKVHTEADARVFYATSPYPLYRQVVHRRHESYFRVLATMRGKYGDFLEFGCGIASVSAWLARRKPKWWYIGIDLSGAHRDYAEARLRAAGPKHWRTHDTLAPVRLFSVPVATAFDVFEHLADPHAAACDLVACLVPGGYLHWNFIDGPQEHLDLASPEQRRETVQYLRTRLDTVWERDGDVVSRKPWR